MLNAAQKQAVNCDAEKILCLAGAGTGKTHSMISRISRLVDEENVDTSNILILTFTNAAACEMRERYRITHKNHPAPLFCTFHSYCYSLISRNPNVAKSLGYFKGTPRIADDAAIRKLHTKCRQQCGTKLSDEKLRGKVSLRPNDKFQYDIYWKQYNKLLKDENYITFDIMCYGVSKLFADNEEIVISEKQKFKYVFVDEFQDTDPKQWDFVSSFTESKLFVVGDAKQAIYNFRRADSSIIKSLAENPEWATIKLSENYRSTAQICDYANNIHKNWKGNAYNLEILSSKIGPAVEMRPELNLFSVKEIMDIVSDAANGKSVAVLCRTNREVSEITDRLDKLGIKYNCKGSKSDVSGLLKSALDSDFCVDWLSNRLKTNDYNDYIKYCSIDDKYSSESGFLELYGNRFTSEFKAISEIRNVLESDAFVYTKISAIGLILEIPQGVVMLNTIDNAGVVEYLIELADSYTKESGLYVGTIHSVKGLEYDCVHMVGVNGSSFPVYKDEEQRNLYYVGCTRAKEKLVIYNSDWIDTSDEPTAEEIEMEISADEKHSEEFIRRLKEEI